MTPSKAAEFEKALASLINQFSMENGSNTPDFILARYLTDCLRVYEYAIDARSQWYGRHDSPAVVAPPAK